MLISLPIVVMCDLSMPQLLSRRFVLCPLAMEWISFLHAAFLKLHLKNWLLLVKSVCKTSLRQKVIDMAGLKKINAEKNIDIDLYLLADS